MELCGGPMDFIGLCASHVVFFHEKRGLVGQIGIEWMVGMNEQE